MPDRFTLAALTVAAGLVASCAQSPTPQSGATYEELCGAAWGAHSSAKYAAEATAEVSDSLGALVNPDHFDPDGDLLPERVREVSDEGRRAFYAFLSDAGIKMWVVADAADDALTGAARLSRLLGCFDPDLE